MSDWLMRPIRGHFRMLEFAMADELLTRIEQLIAENEADESFVITQWYQAFNRPPDDRSIPMSPWPSIEKMWQLFKDWYSAVRQDLVEKVCDKWNSLKEQHRGVVTAGSHIDIVAAGKSGTPVDALLKEADALCGRHGLSVESSRIQEIKDGPNPLMINPLNFP